MSSNIVVRHAEPDDSRAVLGLMQALAEFEGYAERFRVTEAALYEGLFERRSFNVLVASVEGRLVGILTYYHLPFTYDLTPWVYMKELYVETDFRGAGVGRCLMNKLIAECRARGGRRIRWDVLSDNLPAKRFYQTLGARHDCSWELYALDLSEATEVGLELR